MCRKEIEPHSSLTKAKNKMWESLGEWANAAKNSKDWIHVKDKKYYCKMSGLYKTSLNWRITTQPKTHMTGGEGEE